MLSLIKSLGFARSSQNKTITNKSVQKSSAYNHHRRFRGEAIVSDEIKPDQKGRVSFRGSWWPARCEQEIVLLPGDMVEVVGIQDITLLVRAC